MPEILCILNHFKRPRNIQTCIQAWKGQSVPTAVCVCDNSPLDSEPADLTGADQVWRISPENLGPVCRFAPALLLSSYDYFVLSDDDLLPGLRALEHVLTFATSLGNKFATLGAATRVFQGARYSGTSMARPGAKCDLTIGCHFVRADLVFHVTKFRADLLAAGAEKLVNVHDDFLLCQGIQRATRFPSVCVPEPRKLIEARLDEGNVALWRRPGHWAERNEMLAYCLAAGWRTLV